MCSVKSCVLLIRISYDDPTTRFDHIDSHSHIYQLQPHTGFYSLVYLRALFVELIVLMTPSLIPSLAQLEELERMYRCQDTAQPFSSQENQSNEGE
ncbi:hypothetical protein H1R20_g14650, partial [Candolleomyces eurysporus]